MSSVLDRDLPSVQARHKHRVCAWPLSDASCRAHSKVRGLYTLDNMGSLHLELVTRYVLHRHHRARG